MDSLSDECVVARGNELLKHIDQDGYKVRNSNEVYAIMMAVGAEVDYNMQSCFDVPKLRRQLCGAGVCRFAPISCKCEMPEPMSPGSADDTDP